MSNIFQTQKIKDVLPKVKSFVKSHLYNLETPEIMNGNFSEVEPILLEKREIVKQEGLFGMHLSEKEGGLGLSLCEFGQISEILAYSPFGHFVFNTQAPDIGNTELLHKYASDELKSKFLKPLQEGKIRSCFSMTEPEFAGSNPTMMGTMAIKDGSDYIINGHKWFTSSADGAAFAVVMAITNPDAPAHQRASQIIVPLDNPGYEFVRNIPIMGHVGDSWASHAEVKYNNVRVPQSYLVGPEGSGFKLAQERLGPGRIHHCMRFIGIAQRSFDLMCQYALQRNITEEKTLGQMQFIHGFIAESKAEIEAARLLVLNTAHNIDLQGAAACRDEISAIKFSTANMMLRVVDRAIQVHGGLGMTTDVILSYFYTHERASRIYDGADEVHKSALAKNILKNFNPISL
jgi:alkylation response protein AidB-like acyl-CoA dehydrogenase